MRAFSRWWACAALTLLGGVRPVTADEADEALWRRLAAAGDAQHAAAVEAWAGLSPAERLAKIRAAIRSPDLGVARLAAAVADPDALDAGEIERVMATCAADPAWVADPLRRLFGDVTSNGMGFGIPDMVAILRTAATTPGFAFAVSERSTPGGSAYRLDPSDEFHRALDVSLAAEILPLLETPNDEVADRIAGWLDLLASNTTRDDTRPLFARAKLYAAARARAREASSPLPALASIEVRAEGPGVPPAVKALVRGDLVRAARSPRTWADPWLLRWLFDLTPVEEDLGFLREIAAAEAGDHGYAAWAVRGLAALDASGERTGWRALAAGTGPVAVEAAAELARRGDPARLRAFEDGKGPDAESARVLAWAVDAADARARWIARAAAGRPSENVDLTAPARARYAIEQGVTIQEADLVALGEALLGGGEPLPGAAWFFAHVLPDAVTPEVAAVIAKRLAAVAGDRYADEDPDAEGLEVTLACLEVRAPQVLRDLLAGWVAAREGEGEVEALVFLARLGDAGHVEAMLASWSAWDLDAHALGRVRDPRVREFLRARARDEDDDVAAAACAALADALGLPDDLRWSLTPSRREHETFADEPYASARERLLAGDAEGTVLALTRGRDVGGLGALRSEKALALLRRAREARLLEGEPVYWAATAELAVAGDAEGRARWRDFVRAGRVRMLDGDSSAERVLRADPASAEDWIPLLDANCCLGFHAWSKLLEAFPTAPLEQIGPVMTQNRVAFDAWWARHRGTFVWSRILDGHVPGPRAR